MAGDLVLSCSRVRSFGDEPQTHEHDDEHDDDERYCSTAVTIESDAFSRTKTLATSFLIEAIMKGDVDGVKEQLSAGQDPNMEEDWHKYACVPPLACALQARQIDVAKVLIESGADVMFGYDDDEGGGGVSSPMASAICFGGLDAVELLLDNGHPLTRGMIALAVRTIHQGQRASPPRLHQDV